MYVYNELKPDLFTEEAQEPFLKIRDNINWMLEKTGAFAMGNALIAGGSTWYQMACVDRLVELGELREVTGEDVAGQYRVFVKGQRRQND